jgi:ribonuclease P protein component
LDLGLPRDVRLRKRPEYLKVQGEGKRFPGSRLILLILPRGPGPTRFGLTVSRRLGPAVTRNRVKRRLREIVRLNRSRFAEGADLVLIARGPAVKATRDELERELLRLMQAAGMTGSGEVPPSGNPRGVAR